MKRYAKPSTDVSAFGSKNDALTTPTPDVPLSEISVARLLDDGLLALQREMRNLLMASAHGKLDKDSARDLRDTVKLLFELKDREDDLLKGMTDEQLEEVSKQKAPNASQQDSGNSGEGEA